MSKNTEIEKEEKEEKKKNNDIDNKNRKDENFMDLILKSVALAMGVSVLVLNILNTIGVRTSIMMLSVGLFAIALSLIPPKK